MRIAQEKVVNDYIVLHHVVQSVERDTRTLDGSILSPKNKSQQSYMREVSQKNNKTGLLRKSNLREFLRNRSG
jgi:hypothetical protein